MSDGLKKEKYADRWSFLEDHEWSEVKRSVEDWLRSPMSVVSQHKSQSIVQVNPERYLHRHVGREKKERKEKRESSIY
jgi:hypothetical protein